MSISGLCSACKVPYERAWCVADRRDYLRCLIDAYKFENAKAAHVPLASLLDDRLVDLPVNAVVVPIPTIASHIRQRGYDHMLLVAREFARRRNLPLDLSLKRNTHTTQRGAGVKERILQAKNAFICSQKLDPNKIYLILDDVVTSGATVRYAAEALRKAGATSVWVASISRQPLD